MRSLINRLDHDLNWKSLHDLASYTVDQAVAIQQIPAPTFQETERAAYVTNQFRALGLTQVSTDAFQNVYGVLPGQRRGVPGLMLTAHTDTVFDATTDLTTRRGMDGLLFGPGLGDNSIGVAALLALAQYCRDRRITPERDLWFTATTREEGLGDLGGMRAAYEHLSGLFNAVINIEGMALGHIYHAGIAVKRLHIVAHAPGGHSWLHFGRDSAVHAILTLGAQISAITPPDNPRTTFNVGMIDGGHAINAIATQASLWLDMRSVESTMLNELEHRVRGMVDASTTRELSFTIETVGDRPSGYLSPDHALVQGALASLKQVGIAGTLETGSTDGNIPLARGVPAVTVGITHGGNAHRLDEFIETRPVAQGLRHLILFTLAAAYPIDV